MFANPVIDRFSRTHPSIVPALYLPATTFLFWKGLADIGLELPTSIGLCLGGWLTWTLTEYWLHRTFFHWRPDAPWGERLHFLVHGVHHQWPRDRYRLVMPPAVSITLFWLFLGVWVLLLGRYAWSFHAGFTIGYMLYDLTHFWIHHHKPRTPWGKALRRHHLTHHAPHARHGGKFGVSTTLWDHVFGTA